MNKVKLIGLITLLLLSSSSSLSQSGLAALHPSPKCWNHAKQIASVHVSRVSPNRRLASVGDSLYMFNNRNLIVWKWSSDGPPFTDLPIIDSTGTIYVVGYDLLWVAIDANTGQEKWKRDGN